MKIMPPTWRSYPYMVDDRGQRHVLKTWIRGLCTFLVSFGTLEITPLIVRHYEVRSILLQMLIFLVIWFAASLLCLGVVCLIARLGCTKVFKPEGPDLNDPT